MRKHKVKSFILFFVLSYLQCSSCLAQYTTAGNTLKKIIPIAFLEPVNPDTVIDIAAFSYSVQENITTLTQLDSTELQSYSVFRKTFTPSPTFNQFITVFAIKNETEKELKFLLQFGNPAAIRIINITKNSDSIFRAGFMNTGSRKDAYTPNYFVPVIAPPGNINYYQVTTNFIGSYYKQVTPLLMGKSAAENTSRLDLMKTRPKLIFHGIILGGILIMSLFMLTQFFFNRDKSYLFYSLYAFALFLFFEKIMEVDCNIYLITQFMPVYVYNSHIPVQLLISFFYIAFMRSILNIGKAEKRFYYYCNFIQITILTLIAVYFITMFVVVLPNKSIFFIRQLTTIISALAFFPVLLILFQRSGKNKLAQIMLFGVGFILLGALTMIYLNRVLPNLEYAYFAPVTYLELGALIEVLVLGLALGYKANIIKKDKDRFQLQVAETEMAALKAQMNPHFMFNCINSIDAFIHSNDKYNATLYLNKFAKLLRGILESSRQNTVLFSKDIETLKLYVELEELRHENKFTTQYFIDEELMNSDYKVPPLIIQSFVENAILHGLKNRQDNNGFLKIEIRKIADKIEYSINDNGIGRKAAGLIAQNKESSYGMQMSYDRIKLFNKEEKPSVEITDLYNGGIAAGTEVKVLLNII